MILLELFLGFLWVGCFSFGGAYGAIPLIRDVVLSHGWLDEETLTYMIAVSESTPGPIMVNLATYIGSSKAGLAGASLATLAVVLPAFLIILLVMTAVNTLLHNPYMQALLQGIKPWVIGIILATGTYMVLNHCFPLTSGSLLDVHASVITASLFAALWSAKHFLKKRISPIMLIVLSACLGVMVYGGLHL